MVVVVVWWWYGGGGSGVDGGGIATCGSQVTEVISEEVILTPPRPLEYHTPPCNKNADHVVELFRGKVVV